MYNYLILDIKIVLPDFINRRLNITKSVDFNI